MPRLLLRQVQQHGALGGVLGQGAPGGCGSFRSLEFAGRDNFHQPTQVGVLAPNHVEGLLGEGVELAVGDGTHGGGSDLIFYGLRHEGYVAKVAA